MGFSDYNANPDLNVSISGVNIGEGCPPSGINNAMRQIMADAKAFTGGAVLSGGVTIKGGATVSGGLVVSGGSAGMSMATGNINFSKNATISGSAVSHYGQLTMNDATLNFGLYDQTNGKWVVMGRPNGDALIGGALDVNGDTTIIGGAIVSSGAVVSGTLDLPNSTDAQGSGTAAPALRVGPVSGAHLEFDGNEIMAKATSNTVGSMTLNYDGGRVFVGLDGLTVLGGGATVSGGMVVNGGIKAGTANVIVDSGNQSINGQLSVTSGITADTGAFTGTVYCQRSGLSLELGGYAKADAVDGGYAVTNGILSCILMRGNTYVGLWDGAARQWIVRVNDTDGTTNSYWHYGTVKTVSDEREKKDIAAVSDDLLDAWASVRWQQFRYIKNDARANVGIVAQRAESALREHGIDADGYNFISHEQDDGNDKYYVQYTDAFAIEAAYQRRRADRAEARIAALEQRLDELEAVLATLGA